MDMIFDFAPSEQFSFLAAFAGRFGASLDGNTLTLPTWLGVRSIRRIRLAPDFSLLLHQYILTEELILRRTAADNTADRVNVLFQGYAESEAGSGLAALANRRADYTIRITSPDINSELCFPPDVPHFFAVLSMTRPALRQLLQLDHMNGVVEQILVGQQGFLFYETMGADVQKILTALTAVDTGLGQLRTWIQVQELLYWLFERLLARDTQKHRPIHPADVEQLGRVRAAVVADLSTPPDCPSWPA